MLSSNTDPEAMHYGLRDSFATWLKARSPAKNICLGIVIPTDLVGNENEIAYLSWAIAGIQLGHSED